MMAVHSQAMDISIAAQWGDSGMWDPATTCNIRLEHCFAFLHMSVGLHVATLCRKHCETLLLRLFPQ